MASGGVLLMHHFCLSSSIYLCPKHPIVPLIHLSMLLNREFGFYFIHLCSLCCIPSFRAFQLSRRKPIIRNRGCPFRIDPKLLNPTAVLDVPSVTTRQAFLKMIDHSEKRCRTCLPAARTTTLPSFQFVNDSKGSEVIFRPSGNWHDS